MDLREGESLLVPIMRREHLLDVRVEAGELTLRRGFHVFCPGAGVMTLRKWGQDSEKS